MYGSRVSLLEVCAGGMAISERENILRVYLSGKLTYRMRSFVYILFDVGKVSWLFERKYFLRVDEPPNVSS